MSGPDFLYVPFDQAESQKYMKSRETSVVTIAKYYRAYVHEVLLRTPPALVQHGNPATDFSGLNPDDSRVSIIGHCTQGGNSLRSSRYTGTDRAAIEADDLVRRLSGDGVPSEHKQFELIACLAGSASGRDETEGYLQPQLVVSNPKDREGRDVGFIKIGVLMTDTVTWTSSFGERFYRALRKARFRQARVTAYLFPVNMDPNFGPRHYLDHIESSDAAKMITNKSAKDLFGKTPLTGFSITFG